MDNIQTNTRVGFLPADAAVNLNGQEGRLARLTPAGAALLGVATDAAPYVLYEGNDAGKPVTLVPLEPGRQFRLRLTGPCAVGDVLVAAADSSVTVLPAAAGTYQQIGLAEEAGIDGQVVLVRPYLTGLRLTVTSGG